MFQQSSCSLAGKVKGHVDQETLPEGEDPSTEIEKQAGFNKWEMSWKSLPNKAINKSNYRDVEKNRFFFSKTRNCAKWSTYFNAFNSHSNLGSTVLSNEAQRSH